MAPPLLLTRAHRSDGHRALVAHGHAAPRRIPGPRKPAAHPPVRGPRSKAPGERLIRYDEALSSRVAGCDEAGRGCLAGPLVCAAVSFDYAALDRDARAQLAHLNDSKRLKSAAREEMEAAIWEVAEQVVVVWASAALIDRDGVHRTNLRLLSRALGQITPTPEVCLVDGSVRLPQGAPAHETLVGGDRTSAAVAAASIIAKTARDRFMATQAEREFPGYGFAQHMGYATPQHQEAIRRLGPTPLHRMSFSSPAYG